MMLDIFKKPYTLRKFEKTKIVDGYACAKYNDITVYLNVQPLTTAELVSLPAGIRKTKNIKAIGKVGIKTADEKTGILADRLYYRGEWYECTGSDIWGNTAVGQTEAVFGLIANEEAVQLLPPGQSEDEGKDNDVIGDE